MNTMGIPKPVYALRQGLFCSIEDDAKTCEKTRNNVAVSPELSGVTYVQGSRGIWGLTHILQMADSGHLERMKAVVAANEEFLHDGQHVSYGKDYVVNVWVGLTGPAVLAGRLNRYDKGGGSTGACKTVTTPVRCFIDTRVSKCVQRAMLLLYIHL